MRKLALVASFSLLAACTDAAKDTTAPTPAPTPDAKPAVEAPAAKAAEKLVAPAGALTFDQTNSKIEWTGANVMGSQDGSFASFSGFVVPGEGGDVTQSQLAVQIDMDTVTAGPAKLVKHLKSDDFFDVANHPTSSFKSTSITPNEGGGFTVTGDLNLRGVTKPVTFPATLTLTDGQATAKAEFSIKRHDWNVSYKGSADNLLKEDVAIRLDVKAAK